MGSDDAAAMADWLSAVAAELGLTDLDVTAVVDTVLDLTADVAHGVSRPSAPVTAFLLGVAAGRAADPDATVAELAERVSRRAGTWG